MMPFVSPVRAPSHSECISQLHERSVPSRTSPAPPMTTACTNATEATGDEIRADQTFCAPTSAGGGRLRRLHRMATGVRLDREERAAKRYAQVMRRAGRLREIGLARQLAQTEAS
jgi:hypothetical protein